MAFTVIASDDSEPAEVRKAATKARDKLLGLGLEGEIAFAMRLEDTEGMFGFGVPKSLLFADPSKVKAIVGGAPVSEEFAREIGADAYGFDAANAVDKVKALVGVQ